MLPFFRSRRKTITARNYLKKKQSIALLILYHEFSLRVDPSSMVEATEVTKGQGLILGLGISADNIRMNIATGKIFTSCFFRKGTSNYFYIDIKSYLQI